MKINIVNKKTEEKIMTLQQIFDKYQQGSYFIGRENDLDRKERLFRIGFDLKPYVCDIEDTRTTPTTFTYSKPEKEFVNVRPVKLLEVTIEEIS